MPATHPIIQAQTHMHVLPNKQTKNYKKQCQWEKKLPLNKTPQSCKYIQANTWSHILKRRRYHLLARVHNMSLSPAAHQGLGKLPGMKEICSLMAPFSCIWWHKMQLDFFSPGAADMPNDGVLPLLCSLFEDGSFGLPRWRRYQFPAARVHSADAE